MRFYLIRHAHAGHRSPERDIYRPLTDDGRRRAEELADLLAAVPVTHLLSSPATRCAQTLGPLSHRLGLDIEQRDELWEGSSILGVLDLLTRHRGDATNGDAVICSHGDIIPAVIEMLGELGVEISGRGCELGSIWIVDADADDWTGATYVGRKATSLHSPDRGSSGT